ncbi:Pro-interleukin-16 [Amphibalanus amphitrite]|uniref:Pro-interleukin-16 n=1 Tax=Amphibalanus amphitrite TaxID=1232801 RepID=A0A6A4VEI1_AMPAM|nr:Pro-interleukin-16 [Amphibalanus amphitrite]
MKRILKRVLCCRQEPRGGARSGLQRTPPAKEPLQRSSSLNSRPPAGAGDSRRRISDDVGPLEGRRLPARIQPADSDTDVGSSTLTLVAEPLEETSTSRGLRSRAGSFDFDHRASTSTLHASSPVKELDVEEEIRKAAAGEPSRSRSPSLKAISVRDVVDRNWPSIESERADIDRKLSTPSYGGSTPTRLRDRRGHVPSRPQSWVESEQELRILETAGGLLSAGGGAISTSSSQENIMDSLDCGKSPSGSTSSLLEMLTANLKRNARSRHVLSVSDLRRAFERSDGRTCHARMSSMDSTGSEDGPGVAAMMGSSAREHYGSITSLASSTSLISPHELQQLIEEANQSLEEAGTPSHEIIVAVVHREMMGGSIGITLAGGADYENKEISVRGGEISVGGGEISEGGGVISVNKVIRGSVADRDGRIQKGDRVISINGRSMKNTTHREALNTLKAPRAEVVLVLSRSRSVTPLDAATDENGSAVHRPSVINTFSSRPPKILESPMDSKSLASDLAFEDVPRGPPKVVTLVKEGAGVGFSLEGGKDSPLGDRPLMAKKIFAGGAADKSGKLHIGDQILAINDEDVTHMPRIEAWNFLKKQPEGALRLTIRKRLAAGETPAPSASNGSPLLPPGENGGLRAEAPTSRNGSTRPTVTAVTPKVPLQSPEAVLPKA